MVHKAAWVALAAASLALAALSSPLVQEVGELKKGDQKELASLIGAALDPEKAKDAEKKNKAVAELRKFLEKAGKTRNSKDPLQGGLSLTADLSKALFDSADYKMAGRKLGEVVTTVLNPKQAAAKGDAKEDPMSYALWLPKAYRVDVEPYPLLLCLPGAKDGKAQSGETFLQENWMDATLREKVLIAVVNLPEDPKSWSEGQTSTGKPGGIAVTMRALRDVREKYSVDCDRIYICGREAGVAAAISIASKFPHIFAGAIGRAGDSGETPVDNFRGLPTFFAGAGAQAAEFEKKSKEAGFDNCTLKSDGTDLDVLTWMTDHPRIANPVKVTLYPGKPIPSKAYWLKVQPTDVPSGVAKIDAEIDRSKNTITITGNGIRQVTLMLNDVLVDLDKPVSVVLNGTKQDALLPRSL
ncbi:MAG: PHB depolymerase family esterase, partial [Planctomycetota bacterium]